MMLLATPHPSQLILKLDVLATSSYMTKYMTVDVHRKVDV